MMRLSSTDPSQRVTVRSPDPMRSIPARSTEMWKATSCLFHLLTRWNCSWFQLLPDWTTRGQCLLHYCPEQWGNYVRPTPLTVHGLWPTSPDVTNRRSYFFCLFTNLRLTFFTAYTGIGNILIHSGYLNIFPVAPKARDTSAGFLMPTCNAHVSFLEPCGILHSFHSAGI